MADYLYKNELLAAFNLEKFDEKLVNSKIQELYITHFVFNDNDGDKKVKVKTDLKKITKKASEKLLIDDDEVGFIMLFSTAISI
jgi:predicted acetyltransferase